MEIGISMFGDLSYNHATKAFQQPKERLQQMMEQVKLADETGLDVFGIGEHHRKEYAVSSPEIILAAAAGITKNIKLSSAVTVLSSADPVRIYQNFSTVDLLSNGRAEITLGRGSFIESFPLFGYDLQDYDELFTEKLELLLQINNSQEPVTWNGKFRAALHKQHILPRAEKPMDVWIAVGGTPQSVIRAARLGLPLVIAIIGGQPKQFKPFFDLYKKEYIAAGHNINNMQLGVHAHGLIGNDGAATADNYFAAYAQQMNRVGSSRGWPPYSRQQYEAGRTRDGALLIGGVNEVADKILYFKEMFGLTRFTLHVDVGGPTHDELMKTIELFGTKVKPAVNKA